MKKKTFRSKLYSIFIASMILPIIIIAVIFSMFYIKTITVREKKNIEYVLNSIANSIEVQFTELKNISDIYYMQKEVFQEVEALNNPKLYENYDALVRNRMENNYSISIKKSLYKSKQQICDVVFFPINSENGKAYSVDKNHSGLQTILFAGYDKEEWFQEALKTTEKPKFYSNHIPVYRKGIKKDEEVYSYVRAIQSMDTKKMIGVIKIDVSVSNFQKVINVLKNEGKDNIIIKERDMVLASVKDKSDVEAPVYGDGVQKTNKGLYYVKTVKIPDTKWELVYFYSMQEFLLSYALVLLAVFLVTILSVFSALLIYRRYARETLDDMAHITNALREIQTGNMETQVKVQSQNELHEIATAVNKMVHNLKAYIEKEYIWVIRQQKAEYQALQSQINPHFLYNTLNGFIALNRMGETKKLEKSIINLTYLFRYICSGSGETTIEKECDFLKEYLELEKLKYEERLEYMIWIDEECRSKRIPRLLLQPIVENCIVHGMGDTDEPIMITVMARVVETKGIGKVTVVTVRDNGVGFDSKELEDGEEHVGIDNVRIRAEMYWKHVIYQCVSAPGEGTKTTIVFGSEVKEEHR